MPRFEAWFDCGETDERMPEWLVVEWCFTNPKNGARMGQTADHCANKSEAEYLAVVLNAAYERELLANQECEFDLVR